jgi:hypothetical protein
MPEPALAFVADRNGKPGSSGDLAGTMVTHAGKLGDADRLESGRFAHLPMYQATTVI